MTTDQPLQRLWKVNTFPILIFFFWKLHNSKKKKQRMVASAIKLAQWHTWLHGFVCHTNQIKVIMLTLNQESNQIKDAKSITWKIFTRAAGCRPLFQVRYKTFPQLLILMGHGIKNSLIGKFVVVIDLRLSALLT